MANSLGTNPITVDTTDTTLWSGNKYVKSVQWVDDTGDIVADDVLIITVNNTTITAKVPAIDANVSTTHWEFGPFNSGITWTDVGVTIPHGLLIIWVD